MNIRYPLTTKTWDEAEYESIQRVVRSDIFTMGKEVAQFEQDFSSFFGKRYALMVNSGSSANLLMIAALFFKKENPLKAGDEVIVPAVSWSTTYMPLQQYNLKVKFVDIDLHTLNYDLTKLSSAITDKTRAILAVNLLGNPNDFNIIQSLIRDRNIYLLEDNCESMGAKYNEAFAGSIGIMGTFSTFFSHHISTMEGGVLITDDEELYHISLSLRAHGWTRKLPEKNLVTGLKSKIAFEEAFKFVLPGYNLRPLEISGAIGQEQLKKLPSIVENRRLNTNTFKRLTEKYNWLITQNEIGESSWFGFSLIIDPDSGLKREQLILEFEKYGIEYRPIVAGNFTKNQVISYFNYEIHENLHNADLIDSNGLFIGNHHFQMTGEFNALEAALKSF
ncbi:MAG: DegT/DnrJ/EryC1/StrS family aminotransferase [Bacteroidetes bacterium]|nr:DegT/DnrJ/EryC1/StrS family aminotransferase [Bacteroidota bacterium]